MSLTLAETITETTREFSVTGTVPDEIEANYQFRLDDELLTLRDFAAAPITTPIENRAFVGRNRNRWIVTRGNVPAAHTSGATVRGATDAYTSSAGAATPDPFPPTVGETSTLAQVLAQGNDTGGIGIVNQVSNSAADASTTATDSFFSTSASHVAQLDGAGSANVYSEAIGAGGAADAHRSAITSTDANAIATTLALTDGVGIADASTTATSVDGNATATTTATATGAGTADASSTATSATGNSGVTLQAPVGSANAQIYASSVTPLSSAYADFQSGGLAQIHAEDTTTNLLTDDLFIGGGLGLQSTSTVGDTSAAPASVSSIAANSTGQVKLAVVAANAATTNPEIQVNDLPLITTGSGAPGGTFVSLFYVDTTAVTGGGYCWDFVSGAYIKIGTV